MATKKTSSDQPRAYLLRGDDDFQKNQDAEKLLKTLVSDDFADFDLEQLEGDHATSDRVMAGLNVPPFGSQRRVVIVRYANKMNADEQAKLASHLSKVPSSGCLILVNPAAEKVDGKPRRGSEVIGDLSKAVRKIGEVREYGNERPAEKAGKAKDFAKRLFATAGKRIDAQALALFLQRVGSDFAVVSTEAQKLIDYSGDSKDISARDISLVTSETPEEKIFKLVDAVAAKNQAAALKLLDELFESGDNPEADAPKTLATIARQFRLIWQMKMLSAAGVHSYDKASVPADVKASLPSDPNILDLLGRQSWMAERLAKQARPFTRADLARCFNAIAQADMMFKGIEGGVEDPKLIMELLVVELARNDGGRR